MTDNSGDDDETTGDVDVESTGVAASSAYKVLGEFTDSSGAGVLGRNKAGSGTPIGVEGVVPNSSKGYGLATPDDLGLDGIIDTRETDFAVEAGTTATSDATNVVLGHASNTVESGAVGGVVGGGGYDDGSVANPNTVQDDYGTVGGGRGNQAGRKDSDETNATYATVGGGSSNLARGLYTTVGGGSGNEAAGTYATVGGGNSNAATFGPATVGGGTHNRANELGATVAGGSSNAVTAAKGAVGGGGQNVATDEYGTVGGGANNQAGDAQSGTTNATYATVGGGSKNSATGTFATVGGGEANAAAAAYGTIAGGGGDTNNNGNRVTDNYGTVGGGKRNQAGDAQSGTTNAEYATVGGGFGNEATDYAATVAGGESNATSGSWATVAGGEDNSSERGGFVGGGNKNKASGNYAAVGGGEGNNAGGFYAAIGGGQDNFASDSWAAIGGGEFNSAAGKHATVGGGVDNTASAKRATVPGGGSGVATNEDSFVWNDNTAYHDTDPISGVDGLSSAKAVNGEPVTGPNTFSVSAQGGVRFITGSSAVTYIDGGSTGWSTASSRAVKTNVGPFDPEAALEGVTDMEVCTWEYEDEDGDGAGVTHVGPMAEEFHEAFDPDLGDSDAHINSINARGVAYAAIQGLDAKLAEKADRIDDLEAETGALREENERLRERLAALEAKVDGDAAPTDD